MWEKQQQIEAEEKELFEHFNLSMLRGTGQTEPDES